MKTNKKKNLLTNIQPATDALLFWSGFTNNIKHNNKKASKLNNEIVQFQKLVNNLIIWKLKKTVNRIVFVIKFSIK